MTEVHERLRQARAVKYQSAMAAADAMKLPYSTYAAQENGSVGLKADVAERYAKKFGVSLSWLLTGKDDAAEAVVLMAERVERIERKIDILMAHLGINLGDKQ